MANHFTDSCVVCSDTLTKAETRKSIKIQNDLGAKPVDAFLKICQLLNLPFTEIQHDWRFGRHGGYLNDSLSSSSSESNVLPFCGVCLSGFHSIFKLQQQLIQIQDKIEQQIASLHQKIQNSPPTQSPKTANFRLKVLNKLPSKFPTSPATTVLTPAPLPPQQLIIPPTHFQTHQIQTVHLPPPPPSFSHFPPPEAPKPSDNHHDNDFGNNFEDDYQSAADQSDSSEAEDPTPSKNSRSSPKIAPPTSKKYGGDRQPEYFSPVTTDDLGRMVFEGILILPCEKGTSGGYTCGQCNAVIGKKQNSVSLRKAKIHIKGFHLKAYECPQCGKNLTSNDILNQHLNRYHGAPILPCPDCGKPIKDLPSAIKRHQWTHLNKEEKEEWLRDGFNPYDKKKPLRFECRICGKMFRRENLVKRHEVTHVNPEFRKDFKCGQCGKGYTTDQARKEHESHVHSEVKQDLGRLCRICGKTVWKRHWSKHVKRHGEKERSWGCELCGEWAFEREADLERHLRGCRRRRLGEGGYRCDVCGERRETRRKMLEHRRKKHRGLGRVKVGVGWEDKIVEVEEEGGGGRWRCEGCGERWKVLEDVKVHWREKHRGSEGMGRRRVVEYECEVCGRRGIGKKVILKHGWGHVGVEEAVGRVNEGEAYPRGWRRSKQDEMMEVLRGMGVEVRIECGICGEGMGSVGELGEHRREMHKEAKTKRVRRKMDGKKRGRKVGWRMGMRKKTKKEEVDEEEDDEESGGDEEDGGDEVEIKKEVETPSEEDSDDEENTEEVTMAKGKRRKVGGDAVEEGGGTWRRSLRRSARIQVNYVEEDEGEGEEMEFKQSPHPSEEEDDDGEY